MEKCVVTLPITPTANPPLGLVASIIVGDFIARNLGLKFVLALGVQGMRIPTAELKNTVSLFVQHLKSVGVRPDYIWRGDTRVNQELVTKFFIRMMKRSFIERTTADVLVCSCGAVEKLADATEWYEKRRLYSIRGANVYCKLCNGIAEKQQKLVYQFCLNGSLGGLELFPNFYWGEIQEQIQVFSSTSILVSRSRESAVKTRVKNNDVLLDPDFVWQMYLATLPTIGFEPHILLGSNHTLRALVLVRAMQQVLIPKSSLKIVIPPYFLEEGRKRLGGEAYSMERLLKEHRKNSIRTLVGMSLNWSQKESVIQTSQLSLLDKMTQNLEALSIQEKTLADIPSLFAQCNHQKIREVVGLVRRYKDVPDSSPLAGVVDL